MIQHKVTDKIHKNVIKKCDFFFQNWALAHCHLTPTKRSNHSFKTKLQYLAYTENIIPPTSTTISQVSRTLGSRLLTISES